MIKKKKTKLTEVKKGGSSYKPFIGINRARSLFGHYIEEAERGDKDSAALVFKYLFSPLKPNSHYCISVDMSTPLTQAQSILEATYQGKIDVDSANKLLDGVSKLITIQESQELEARIKSLEEIISNEEKVKLKTV